MKESIDIIVSDSKLLTPFIFYLILLLETFIPSIAFSEKEFWKDCSKAIRRNISLSEACVTLKLNLGSSNNVGALHLLEHSMLTGKDEFKMEQQGLYIQAYTDLQGLSVKIYCKEEAVPKALKFLDQLGSQNFFSYLTLKEFNQQKHIVLLEDKTLKVWGIHKESHQKLNRVEDITLDQIKQIHKKYWNKEYFFLTIDYPMPKKRKLPLLKSPLLFALGEGKGSSLYRIFRLQLGSCYSCGVKSNELFIYSDRCFTEACFKDLLLKDIDKWDQSHLERIQKLGPLEIKEVEKMTGEMPQLNLDQLKTSARQWVLAAHLEVIPEKEGLFYISLKNHNEGKDLP